jgi:hypothetical protein
MVFVYLRDILLVLDLMGIDLLLGVPFDKFR